MFDSPILASLLISDLVVTALISSIIRLYQVNQQWNSMASVFNAIYVSNTSEWKKITYLNRSFNFWKFSIWRYLKEIINTKSAHHISITCNYNNTCKMILYFFKDYRFVILVWRSFLYFVTILNLKLSKRP